MHVALESNVVFHSFLNNHEDGHNNDGHGHSQHGSGVHNNPINEHSIMNFIVKRLKVELATPE